MSYRDRLREIPEVPTQGTAKTVLSPFGSKGSAQGSPFPETRDPFGSNDSAQGRRFSETKPRTRAGLTAALSEACEGLPVTLVELVAAFGTEGEADWLESYEPHCRPEFLRAFAATVSARLERKQAAGLQPETAPEPTAGPLDGLALLPEDWRLVERRTRGRRNRESLLEEYAHRWKEAAGIEPVEHRKANAGRFAANTWLRGIKR